MSASPRKLRKYGSRKDQVGRKLVGLAELGQLLSGQCLGLARQGGPLEEHPADLVAEGTDAPPLDAAHLRVEFAVEVGLQGDDLDEVAPAELAGEPEDEFAVGEDLGEADHACQVPLAEALAVLGGQFCRQCRQNLLAVSRPLVAEHVGPNAAADLPVKEYQGGVDDLSDGGPRRVDQLAEVGEKCR